MYLFKAPHAVRRYLYRQQESPRQAPAAADRHIALPLMNPVGWLRFVFGKAVVTLAGTIFLFNLALIIFASLVSIVYSAVNPPVTSLMVERLADDRYTPRPLVFVPLKNIPEYAQYMYIRLEDKNFYTHIGIDPGAIAYASEQNSRWGRVVMGGSTITQQLVRSLVLSPAKNYFRKYIEAVIAVVMDAVMDKQRIMELYLNYIEWGRGVYGIGAAAQFYFHKPATDLNYDEYARLAAIIVNPVGYSVFDFYRNPAMAYRYYALVAPPSPSPEPSVSPSPAAAPDAKAAPDRIRPSSAPVQAPQAH